ncbi:N-6 DNA methylase [Aurantimonas marina]|uniref:N-6 DNA methylase n=1 Tax=Aurantimonas marina TaxID=2780508 RepID=UPI0019D00AD3|nr:N-6 DNA methylase [Aurantimonas marina]
MPLPQRTSDLLVHLSGRPGHDEVKADFRSLLTEEFGADIHSVDFERRVPEVRGRIDALIGRTVFEAKSNLDRELGDVERRMPDYLADRQRETGESYIGIASDGLKWIVYELASGALVKIKETTLDPDKGEQFLAWLDGAVALKSSLPPEALTIRMELGEESIAFRRASEELSVLWDQLKLRPDVALKKQLWSSLLRLVYGRDIDNEALWIQHTFLVVVAKCLALAVLDLKDDDPASVLSGRAFQQAGISGAVESDFFDWVIAAPEGERLVRRIMAHVRRFRLREVQSDVLKIIYESLIDRDERHGLGEYYTPDWLAAKVVRNAVERPAEQRVLDPACGSGTFLFHALRTFLAEAEEIELPMERRAVEATRLVAGMDIHPVAVIIARVTYLLALAPVLGLRKGGLTIPVYLGDAMQLSISQVLTGKELKIRVPPPPAGDGQSGAPVGNGAEFLDFPEAFCRDPDLFDKAIERMRTGSEEGLSRQQIEAALRRITVEHYNAIPTLEKREDPLSPERLAAIGDLGRTYVLFDRLRKEGRDTVWAYVARNLSRPLFLSSEGGWANVIVGNPPWVAFRHMSADLQPRFKELAKDERVYVGGKLTTQNDLAALFTVRAAALYLRSGGRLAFVLPLAALTRGQFERLRSGVFASVRFRIDETWTMDDGVQPLFPVPSCAMFVTKRRIGQQNEAAIKRRAYRGFLPYRDAPEDIADTKLHVDDAPGDPAEASFEGGSPYRKQFRQGATLVPRFLCFVEHKRLGALGSDPSAPFVASRRTTQEKQPWKTLPSLEGRVEAEFLRPVLLGESILPYRVWRPFEGVVPVTERGEVLSSTAASNRGYQHIANWMREAERMWTENATEANKLTLNGRWNYHGELSAQFPIAPLRVVYAKAGNHPASCIVRDDQAVIDHKLYWSAIRTEAEAAYLTAIFNAEAARSLIEHLQARGLFGARDFDKVMFHLPIPRYDAASALHADLAAAAQEAETLASTTDIPEGMGFQRARRVVRDALADAGIAQRIDALVKRLIEGS